MSKLILRYPNNVVKEVEFDQPKYKIGTAPDNDLILEHEEAEAHQAEIDAADGSFSIVDVSEGKTTTVNGKQIERANLNYGDRISFGPVIGLFYPSQKKTIAPRTKLSLYLVGGALVIVFSIAFIFFLTSRRISDVVSDQIGPVVSTEDSTPRVSTEQYEVERPLAEQERPPETRIARRFSLFRKRAAEGLELPEPKPEQIQARSSVAIPSGLEKLFFKKIPVYVEEKTPSEEEEISLEEPVSFIGREEAFAERALQAPSAEEQLEREETFEEYAEEPPPEREGEEGFLARTLNPVKRIFGRKSEASPEEQIESAAGEELPPGQAGKTAASGESRVLPEDVKRMIEPFSGLKTVDIEAALESDFEEKPVYSKEELLEFQARDVMGMVVLSEAETSNANLLWSFQKDGMALLRTGTIGKIDKDRSLDFLFGSKEGTLTILSGSTGVEILSRDFGKPFFEPILLNADRNRGNEIILVFEDGTITAFTAGLERLWNYEGRDRITSVPLIIDVNSDRIDDLVFSTLMMDIIAIDGSSGFELWRFFDAESETLSSPVGVKINGDSVPDVIFVTTNGTIHALDGKTGWELWSRQIEGRPAGGCAVADLDGDRKPDIVCITKNGILTALDSAGSPLFSSQVEGRFRTTPSLGDVDRDGNVEILLIDDQGTVRAIEGKTRREKWKYESEMTTTAGRLAIADVSGDGALDVICTLISGLVVFLDGTTGAPIAQFNCGDFLLSTPLVFDLSGERMQKTIAASYGGNVFAIQTAAEKGFFSALKKSSWKTVNHDNRNTGFSRESFDVTFWN